MTEEHRTLTRNVQLDDGSWVTIPTAYSFEVKACRDDGCGCAHVLLKDKSGAYFAEAILSVAHAKRILDFALSLPEPTQAPEEVDSPTLQ